MRTIHRAAFIGCLLVSSLAQGQSSLPAGIWRTADAPPELRYQISRADLIIVSMQDALLRELKEADHSLIPSIQGKLRFGCIHSFRVIAVLS